MLERNNVSDADTARGEVLTLHRKRRERSVGPDFLAFCDGLARFITQCVVLPKREDSRFGIPVARPGGGLGINDID